MSQQQQLATAARGRRIETFLRRPRTDTQRGRAIAAAARASRPRWPEVGNAADASRRLLDFTPVYLAAARVAVPELERAYALPERAYALPELERAYADGASGGGAPPLHLVVLLRDPVRRTRSHFCMVRSALPPSRCPCTIF